MPVLAYCITEAGFVPDHSLPGVSGAAVDHVTAGDIRCFLSRYEGKPDWQAKQAALEFHRLLQQILARTAVVPFRFPTLLQDDAELATHLRDHQQTYNSALERVQDSVQMELRITASTRAEAHGAPSGREYLQQRQSRSKALELTAAALRQAASPCLQDWRERRNPRGIRCYALIKRSGVDGFSDAMRAQPLPAGVSVRLSGPWPATEFMELP